MSLLTAGQASAQYTAGNPNDPACPSTNPACNVCMKNISNFTTANPGQKLIGDIFAIINDIIKKMESAFYGGIITNQDFQRIIGVAFIMYIAFYGAMILFNLASHRSGEVANRLIKIGIVYCMCTAGGWTFFSQFIQTPVIHGINKLITTMAHATAGTGASCNTNIYQGKFDRDPITPVGTTMEDYTIKLETGPMEMLYGPIECVMTAKFMGGIGALITTGFYGWLLALLLIWGLLEFSYLVMGALATYVKAIVGLTFLFGLAPLFFAFYLFEKSRSITESWLNMVVGFALQPVMLFAFLAFYCVIIVASVANLFTDAAGNPTDICYVPFYSLPGMAETYWWRFTNSSNVAGGSWLKGNAAGGPGELGSVMPAPAQILSALYFVVLCNLGKNFSNYINELSFAISGGRGGASISGEQVGSWFSNDVTGGRGFGGLATDGLRGVGRGLGAAGSRLSGASDLSTVRSPISTNSWGGD